MDEPTIVTLADAEACSLASAERIVEILDVAIDARGEAHWATTGGSAPGGIYRHLAGQLRDELDWRKVRLWWTDDRFVPHDHPLSNVKIALDLLLDAGAFSGASGTGASGVDVLTGHLPGVPIRTVDVHPFATGVAIGEGRDSDWCAARYVSELRADGPDVNDADIPAFDLMLLGVGPDGHILSVFPNSDAFDRDDLRWLRGRKAPQGRFNAGQKINAALTAAFTILFGLSGLLLWFGEQDTRLRFASTVFLHDGLMYISLVLLVGHLYLALIHPATRHALRGMTLGDVRVEWAMRHHAKWEPEGVRIDRGTRAPATLKPQ